MYTNVNSEIRKTYLLYGMTSVCVCKVSMKNTTRGISDGKGR